MLSFLNSKPDTFDLQEKLSDIAEGYNNKGERSGKTKEGQLFHTIAIVENILDHSFAQIKLGATNDPALK